MWIIYDKTGVERCRVEKIEYNGTWMGESFVTCNINSPLTIPFDLGDYIEYRGERFTLNYAPEPTKQHKAGSNGDAFCYKDLKFNSFADELTRCDFLDIVRNDNNIHFTSLPTFSFFAQTIQDLADRLQANLDRLYTDEQEWVVVVDPDCKAKTDINISVNNIKVWEALALCKSEFDTSFIIRGRTITIGSAGLPIDHVFRYGKSNGLYEIAKQPDSSQGVITRLRAYGSTRNLPNRYYNKITDTSESAILPDNMAVRNLMLPGFPEETLDPFIDSDNINELGIREGTVIFDGSNDTEEIYPSIEGMTIGMLRGAGVDVREGHSDNERVDEVIGVVNPTDNGIVEEGESPETKTFKITVLNPGFNITDYLTGEDATVSMKSGMCGAREFKIRKNGVRYIQNIDAYEYTCERVLDDDLDIYFPNSDYRIRRGDTFVYLNIDMPDAYIKVASQRLLTAATEYLAKNDYSRYTYAPKIDEIFMARQHRASLTTPNVVSLHDTIKEGGVFHFEDGDLNIEGDVIIDTLKIKEDGSDVPTYEVTLREDKSIGSYKKLQEKVDSIANSLAQGVGGYSATQIRELIRQSGREWFLSRINEDTAADRIKFSNGLTAGTYTQGASGAAIDAEGNAEVESLVVRTALRVKELVHNRLSVREGDVSFSDSGIVESVASTGFEDQYRIALRPRWEGDNINPFHYDDIIYGIKNDLDNSGQYTTVWARVVSIPNDTGMAITYYADEDCPAGVNGTFEEGMVIARWGNVTQATAEWVDVDNPRYDHIITVGGVRVNPRKQSWLISTDSGAIQLLQGVSRPKLSAANYGVVVGKLPQGLVPSSLPINPRDPYIFARAVVAENFYQIDWDGNVLHNVEVRITPETASINLADDRAGRTISVDVDVYVDNVRLEADSPRLAFKQFEAVPTGYQWSFSTYEDERGKHFRYTFRLDSGAQSAILAVRVEVDGVLYSKPLRITVVRNGADGDIGLMVYPAGEYDESTTYQSMDGTTPVVLYNEHYYMLLPGLTWKGADVGETPAENYAETRSRSWELMTQFNSVFANIVMANFAKLDKAVFANDHMISQRGVKGGVVSDDYRDYGNGFTPNIDINFLTGAATFNNATVRGEVNAEALNLGYSDSEVKSLIYCDGDDGGDPIIRVLPALPLNSSRSIEIVCLTTSRGGGPKLQLAPENNTVHICYNPTSAGEQSRVLTDGVYKAIGVNVGGIDGGETYWRIVKYNDIT